MDYWYSTVEACIAEPYQQIIIKAKQWINERMYHLIVLSLATIISLPIASIAADDQHELTRTAVQLAARFKSNLNLVCLQSPGKKLAHADAVCSWIRSQNYPLQEKGE